MSSRQANVTAIPDTTPVHTSGPQCVPEQALAYAAVVVGNAGSGKSSSARGSFVEPLVRSRRRVCIIDPTGVWWGLRFNPDGSPGLPVLIVGGLHGDRPLGECDAVSLANWVGEQDDVQIIVDVSEMTLGERQEFATEFFAQLYKSNRRPLQLIIDEADEFAPQNPLPETRRMLHHLDRIVRRGRVRGFRPMLITQRPSVLHKNVMSQANILIAMCLLGSQDRDAVQLWIKGQGDVAAGKEVLNTLARMQVGEGWVWIPRLAILNRGRFSMFDTFDSMRTPEDDEPPVEPPGPFPWRAEFAKRLEGVTDDTDPDKPDYSGQDAAQFQLELETAEQRGYERGLRAGVEKGYEAATSTLQGKITGVIMAGESFMLELHNVSRQIAGKADVGQLYVLPTKESAQEWAARMVTPKPIEKAKSRVQNNLALNGAAEKLLQALVTVREAKKWTEICVLAGLAYANGYFYGGRKMLIDTGLAEESGGLVLVTSAGARVAGGMRDAVTRAEIVATWSAKLRSPGGLMLQAIAGARSLQMDKAQLAAALKIKPDNGYWYGGVKAMRDANLVEQEGDVFRATPIVRAAR